MNKIKTLLGFFPYYLSRIIPTKKNVWLFGSWHGYKYGDSSRVLFEYVSDNKKNIKAVWVSRDKNIVKKIREKKYRAYSTYSVPGVYYSIVANVNVFNVSVNDITDFFPGKNLVNLWHGVPIKKIGYDNKVSSVINKEKIEKLHRVFPYIRCEKFIDLQVACSFKEAENLSTAFDLSLSKIAITGLPRNDLLFEKMKNTRKFKVIYMPTWREKEKINIFEEMNINAKEINEKLKKLDIYLEVKPHPNNTKIFNFDKLSNMCLYNNKGDVYEHLNDYDILITDYSSVYIDYLLTDKPIIFVNGDIDSYLTEDRELYYDYNSVTPGIKCSTWNDVISAIEIIKTRGDTYHAERQKVRDYFHFYNDGNSSQRVFNCIYDRFM
ncbi:hypothetical protein DZF84_20235 [Vibrio parahaemolyticus]|uniref:CDP-glycerol glycerophosphotransferase family protein n=1 Tax=Vibrio parahaemolyticus TaxID=670 RepID=UPI00084B0D0E|nr:CDP-glycerol glycerophosphotransferase family protein [Vibrio parahaemolyticus]EGQ8219535.1 hypothetical protein [Vibrio parahaemolyticus]EGQ8795789.1 hypothetical protein [Vibrio parahaemolyticus]EGR2253874.1 hypothetical protein [Vibrio parahaemolyticus]EGU8226336.1 hypothetical protein [Vibrio parahaemolyticus]EHK9061934.1 CDP-glycerol glycerophosphotransferase family protein [Vibrio parahaemolyticus]